MQRQGNTKQDVELSVLLFMVRERMSQVEKCLRFFPSLSETHRLDLLDDFLFVSHGYFISLLKTRNRQSCLARMIKV